MCPTGIKILSLRRAAFTNYLNYQTHNYSSAAFNREITKDAKSILATFVLKFWIFADTSKNVLSSRKLSSISSIIVVSLQHNDFKIFHAFHFEFLNRVFRLRSRKTRVWIDAEVINVIRKKRFGM